MIYPSVQELSDEGVNRYMLSIATAKCARRITQFQLEEQARMAQEAKEDKFSGYKKHAPFEKPVKEAINKLYSREFKVIPPNQTPDQKN